MRKNRTRFFTLVSLIGLAICIGPFSSAVSRDMESYPRVKLQSLDKVTARTMTFEARVGSTLKFGPLYIKVRSCQKTTPIEQPESAAFLQIWEIDAKKKAQWVFSGWMFASSPALSPMDHPVYDVWLIDCVGKETEENSESTEEFPEEETSGKQKDGLVTGKHTKPEDFLEE